MKSFVALIAVLLFANNLTARAPQSAAARGRIEGRVLRSGTTEPVAGATVQLLRLNDRGLVVTPRTDFMEISPGTSGQPRPAIAPSTPLPLPVPEVLTDSSGSFSITNLEVGSYRLSVTCEGYVHQEYGQRAFPGQGTSLKLAADQILRDLVIPLVPTGNIGGRVVDESGKPASGVRVQLLQVSYNRFGERILRQSGTTKTDDRGQYRLYWITPGKYFLAAGQEPGPRANDGINPNALTTRYAFTYYPGVVDLASSSTIELQPGDERILDISVKKQRLHSVRGRVIDGTTGAPPAAINLSLVFPMLSGLGGMFNFQQAYNAASGTFELRDVTPGKYVLQAETQDSLARLPLEVFDTDTEAVALTLRRGVTVSGRIRVDGVAVFPGAGARLQIVPAGGMAFLEAYSSEPLNPDGTFIVKNVMPGEYRLAPLGARGLFLKDVRFNGRDVLNRVFDVGPGGTDATALEIILNATAGQIQGIVTDQSLHALSGVAAVLVPERNRDRFDLFKPAITDQFGRFTLTDIAPGNYKLFAWDVLEAYQFFDAELLLRSEPLAKSVVVTETSKLTVEIQVIPAGQ